MDGEKDKDLDANVSGDENEKQADAEKKSESEVLEHSPVNEISPNPQIKDSLSLENLISNLKSLSTEQKKDPKIVPFSPDAGMEWLPWLSYFEAICVENNLDSVWRIRNIESFLKTQALTLYINNCLNIIHWEELKAIFHEHFSPPGEPSLTDFTNIRFKSGDDLNEYYQKKTKIGRELGLENKFILEGLTEGLPFELRKLVITNTPTNLRDWRELVHKLSRLQTPWKGQENKNSGNFNQQNSTSYGQWRPQRPNFNNLPHNTPRPTSYRTPYQTFQPRTNDNRNSQRQIRPQNNTNTQTSRPSVHFQESFPPSPCWVCLNVGIPNAYHWVRNCPFRNETLNPNQFSSISTQDTSEQSQNFDQSNSNSMQGGNNNNA